MENETVNEKSVNNSTYPVIVTNLMWSKNSIRTYRSKYDAKKFIPSQMLEFDVPNEKLKKLNKSPATFNDELETYIYNTLTNKYGRELYSCQIWMPLEASISTEA